MKYILFIRFFTSIIIFLINPLSLPNALAAVNPIDVLQHYAYVAHARYEDALNSAKQLDNAIDALIAFPSKEKLDDARLKWIKARIPYQQSEVNRFISPTINELNKKINEWPIDEGFIDYVDISYIQDDNENELYNANIIANSKISVNGQEIDISVLTPELIRKLHGANGVSRNVTTGYHAIEFLLWGQDLQTKTRKAGDRPYTDFSIKKCTGGNCKKRADYLKIASTLLISDLEKMAKSWSAEGETTKLLMKDIKSGLNLMIKGMTYMSYGELAGDRMNLGLVLHDPEQEIDRFSDNTHASYLNNIIGIASSYTGEYTRINSEKISGASISDLIRNNYKNLDIEINNKLYDTLKDAYIMAEHASHVESYDQMINDNNPIGNKIVRNVIDDLIRQTESLRKLRIVFDLKEADVT
ncbi:imelysin family protein [Candidatus Liberibacter americanus]|uniref:Iron-regulated protein n=1 Tax=Candidatus Liberibacter americanus str. Sao Paulo TaxID=1261131 RepID=U6B696_9HYPH|nr:imelysin family protein [Candidatus Liberibacter americanus]AHA27396.1 iron-regulated protein [Candidatus Liberibacter americanus str. Sao Paulo]EMS36669.1 hypothetical protein G653_00440 [Candidatus Liberibacter americanus PW_SP]